MGDKPCVLPGTATSLQVIARRFTEPTNPNADLMPPLHDVQLVTAKPDLLTLTGYEVSASNGGKPVHYRQSWVLRPVTDAEL